MPFSEIKRYMVAKLETTSGTAETLANADFNVRLSDITFDPEIEQFINWFASGRHSKAAATPGKRKCSVSCKIPMRVGAAVGTAPTLRKFLIGCGAAETVVALTSVAYTPVATSDHGNGVSLTIGIYIVPASGNLLLATIKGAMGNAVLSLDELGQPLLLAPTFQGAFVGITEVASGLALTSPDTSLPPAVLGSAVTAASVAQQIGKMSLDFGNDVQLEYDPAQATGYLAAYIAKREPKWTMDPQTKLITADAHYTRWAAGTEASLSLATATVGGVDWTVSAPAGQLMAMKSAGRNGSEIWDQEYELHETGSGNNEWQILQS